MAVQLVGGGLAVWGLVRTYRYLGRLPGYAQRAGGLAQAASRRVARLARGAVNRVRRVLGLPARTVTASGFASLSSVTASGSARGRALRYGRRERWPHRELVKLRADLRDLEGRVLDVRDQLEDTTGQVRRELAEERQARADGDREAREHADERIAEALGLEALAAFVILVGLGVATAQTVWC